MGRSAILCGRMPTGCSIVLKRKRTNGRPSDDGVHCAGPGGDGMMEWWTRSLGRAIAIVALIGSAASLNGCGHETKVTRVDTGIVTDLSGRWNDTDSQMVAEAMVKEALANPWLGNFTKAKNREPIVIVGTVLNKSHEHINVQTFVSDLER